MYLGRIFGGIFIAYFLLVSLRLIVSAADIRLYSSVHLFILYSVSSHSFFFSKLYVKSSEILKIQIFIYLEKRKAHIFTELLVNCDHSSLRI